MGRSLEGQTQATTTTNTTTSTSTTSSMENSTPEVMDQNGLEPEVGISTTTSSVPTSPVVPSSNGGSSPRPRLVSITTGLLLGQKSHLSSTTTPSNPAVTPKAPSSIDSVDQAASSYFARSARFEDEETGPRRTASFGSTVASTLNAHRRAAVLTSGGGGGGTAAAGGGSGTAGGAGSLTETELRRFVFHHTRAKRLVSGLRVHALTRQTFVSSFTVGLAIGSVVAIVLKILKDVASRMLYS